MSIKLLIGDPHPMAICGVKGFVAGTEIEVVGETGDGSRAVELVEELNPDVALLAVRMPGEDGLGALARIQKSRPETAVVLTACHDHPIRLARAHALGASGFLVKDFTRETLLATIRLAASGEGSWTREDMRRVTGVLTTSRLGADTDAPLTPREGEVLQHLAQGLTNHKIAEALGISYETVKEHVQHVLRKIGVADRTQAAVWAVRNGLA